MRKAFLNGKKIATKEALHAELARQLDFPAYYGANLDALYDVLSAAGETEIEISDEKALAKALGDYYDHFIEVVEDAADENPDLDLFFIGGASYSHILQHFIRRRGR